MATQSKSLADKAYHTIKTNILNLTYPPGMPLTEAILTEELEMSRNPVRTAIKMLQAEGLIVSGYHKSMTVKEITDKDIEEIYQLRELFEGSAFKLIFSSNRFEEYSYRIEEKVVRMCAAANNHTSGRLPTKIRQKLSVSSIIRGINKFYESNLFELIRMGLYSLKNGMQIEKTNANLKKMVQHMRNNDYENAYAILTQDHFMTGKTAH